MNKLLQLLQNKKYFIDTKLLLALTLIAIAIVYYIFIPFNTVIQLIKDEYILISFIFLFLAIFIYFKIKFFKLDVLPFMGNIKQVSLLQSAIFFIIFEVIDFIYEDGFIGMIKLWIMYWLFALLAYFIMNNINYYKNMKFYRFI